MPTYVKGVLKQQYKILNANIKSNVFCGKKREDKKEIF